jgi:serine/threonine protein kinase
MARQWIREYEITAGPFSGTYGQVSIGQHKLLGWVRAIKQLHHHVRQEVLLQEARTLKEVRSPYVVQIFEFFDDPPAIVMEYCPTGLDSYLRERFTLVPNGLPYDEARELLHGLLEGVNDAHQAKVIHGDIKPANVRFGAGTAAGQLGLPKLGDFGAGRHLRDNTPGIRGSTNWMAPELLAGNEPTEASDYFSFGVLAYLVLTGRHPFFANDPSCLTSEQDSIASSAFVPVALASLRDDIPRRVGDLVMEVLSRDPRVRRQPVQELRTALAELPEREEPRVIKTVVVEEPSTDELEEVEHVYSAARELFLSRFRPKEAVQLLDSTLSGLNWERFRGADIVEIAECWSLRAYINNAGGHFDDAVAAATNGLSVCGTHVSSLQSRGYAWLQLGQYGRAEEDLKNALELSREPRRRAQISKLLDTLRVRKA